MEWQDTASWRGSLAADEEQWSIDLLLGGRQKHDRRRHTTNNYLSRPPDVTTLDILFTIIDCNTTSLPPPQSTPLEQHTCYFWTHLWPDWPDPVRPNQARSETEFDYQISEQIQSWFLVRLMSKVSKNGLGRFRALSYLPETSKPILGYLDIRLTKIHDWICICSLNLVVKFQILRSVSIADN